MDSKAQEIRGKLIEAVSQKKILACSDLVMTIPSHMNKLSKTLAKIS